MSRKTLTLSTKIDTGKGKYLQILVENVGRKSYGYLSELKGIFGGVTLNDKKVEKWNITSFPFANMANLTHLIDSLRFVEQDKDTLKRMDQTSGKLTYEPIIYEAQFNIDNGKVNDTYIDTRGWGKVAQIFHSQLIQYPFVAGVPNANFDFFSSLPLFNKNRIRASLSSTASI